MKDLNVVTIEGNLGRAPDVRQTKSGASVITFDIANNVWVGREHTSWIRVTSMLPNIVEYGSKFLAKGSRVLVVGELVIQSVEKDGSKRYYTQINAREVLNRSSGDRQPAQDPAVPEEDLF